MIPYIVMIALVVFLEIRFDFFSKNFKKMFKEKTKEKIIVFLILTLIILFSASLGSNQIANF